jgi:hypothetical protein
VNELDIILKSITAAKAANLAAIHALDAVERMLEPKPSAETLPIEPATAIASECTHGGAVLINTSAGTFRVCECGFQEQL